MQPDFYAKGKPILAPIQLKTALLASIKNYPNLDLAPSTEYNSSS